MHRCRISYLMGCGYQEIGFHYQEILPGISHAFSKWMHLVAICACFWPKIYRNMTIQLEILINKPVTEQWIIIFRFYNFSLFFVFSGILIFIIWNFDLLTLRISHNAYSIASVTRNFDIENHRYQEIKKFYTYAHTKTVQK